MKISKLYGYAHLKIRGLFSAIQVVLVAISCALCATASADYTAGISSAGSTAYPSGGMRRIGVITTPFGDHNYSSSVLDEQNGFAYFGTRFSPGCVAKIRLSDLTLVTSLTLHADENELYAAVLDPPRGYAYFGAATYPGKIIRVRLADMTRVDSIDLASGENAVLSAAIDVAGGYGYFGLNTVPAQIIKVRLSDFTRVATLALNKGENHPYVALTDLAHGYLYMATDTSPAIVIKIRLSDFTRQGAIIFANGENHVYAGALDPAGAIGYFAAQGIIVKVNLATMAEVGSSAPSNVTSAIATLCIPSSGEYAYCATAENRVARVHLPDLAPAGYLALRSDEKSLDNMLMDSKAEYAYMSGYYGVAKAIKIGLTQKGACKFTRISLAMDGKVQQVGLYSHQNAGQLRMAIYQEQTTSTRKLLWQSAGTTNTAKSGFMTIPIAAGTTNSLTLAAGNYDLAWQTDASSPVPSYVGGNNGDGGALNMPFGEFPATLEADGSTSWTSTSERWSGYISYLSAKNGVPATAWTQY